MFIETRRDFEENFALSFLYLHEFAYSFPPKYNQIFIMLHGFTLQKAIMFKEFPDTELPDSIDLSQNLIVWSCDESVLCAVFCEAKHRNGRMLRHNSVFCVPFCANGAQKE
jgi:hypothetical protein